MYKPHFFRVEPWCTGSAKKNQQKEENLSVTPGHLSSSMLTVTESYTQTPNHQYVIRRSLGAHPTNKHFTAKKNRRPKSERDNAKKFDTFGNFYRSPEFITNQLQPTNLAANTSSTNIWLDPLPQASWSVPIGKYHPGGFAFARKHSIHTGVDLYCPEGTEVAAVESGVVVAVEYFTGPEAASPWYNTTMAVLVEGQNSVVLYGEIRPNSDIKPGKSIEAGEIIGNVMAVLKQNKGNGTSMLHFELYTKGTTKSVWWEHGKSQPRRLLDPTQKLLAIKVQKI